MVNHSNLFCSAFLLTFCIWAEAAIIPPIRHSLPSLLESVNGSSSDGGCTSRDGSICNLQDGGTSVLFDNTILPLSGLDGNQWARDLFTVRRQTVGNGFILIGFDFGNRVRVRRVELVFFNCWGWSIRASDIEVRVEASENHQFPQLDPTYLPRAAIRLRKASDDSCEKLYRVCVSIPAEAQSLISEYYIVFPNAAGSDWVHLAEVTFYNDTNSCAGRETFITEPVTPQVDTTTEAIGTTSSPMTTSLNTTFTHETTNCEMITTQTILTQTQDGTIIIIVVVVIATFLLLLIAIVSVIIISLVLMRRRTKHKSVDNGNNTYSHLNHMKSSDGKLQPGINKQSNNMDLLYDAIQLTPTTGQIEIEPSFGYDTIDTTKIGIAEEKEVEKPAILTTPTREDGSVPETKLEEMYSVVQKKPKMKKAKENTEDGTAPPIPPHTVEDTYAVVQKKPKDKKARKDKNSPSMPPQNVGEMYAVVQKKKKKSEYECDEEDPPPIPPHTADELVEKP